MLAQDAIKAFPYRFMQFTAERLRVLLEEKHLYQKVSLNPSDIIKELLKEVFKSEHEAYVAMAAEISSGNFLVSDKHQFTEPGHRLKLCLIVSNVKLFCSTCNAREAFRPIWFSDITGELIREKATHTKSLEKETFRISFAKDLQLFSLVFQCQHCQGLPEAFLVKRRESELVLEGRSPIEHLEIPKYIPKEERRWFSDAVVAFQSGKVLAALFYLRTFIEQFARRQTNQLDEKKTGDEILTGYATLLPVTLRDAMPSLREWYDKLSEALHRAKEDTELFEAARERIEKHFDIRRVHDLDSKQTLSAIGTKVPQP
jgi:hypothetical protein